MSTKSTTIPEEGTSNDELCYAADDGSWGGVESLLFFTVAELEQWAAESEYDDYDEFIEMEGDRLHSLVLERTGRSPGVPLSVIGGQAS